MSLFLERFRQSALKFLSNGWLCIAVAVAFLVFGFLGARNRNSSAGLWTFIVIGAVLILWGLGQVTGLGFGMSF